LVGRIFSQSKDGYINSQNLIAMFLQVYLFLRNI